MTVEHWHENPDIDQDGWHDQADHWKCTLTCNRKTLTVYVSISSFHGGRKPELAEVLDSLAYAADSYENDPNFADWASEYGYNPDSPEAARDYNTAKRVAGDLVRWLGEEGYEELLWSVPAHLYLEE